MSDDKSTTEQSTEDQAPEEGRPEESIDKSAESQRSDVPAQQPEQGTEEEPSQEEDDSTNDQSDELIEWAKKKGIDPNDPKTALKMAYENEKFGKQQKQQVSELKKQFSKPSEEGHQNNDTEQERLLDEMRLHSFYAEKPEARQYDQKMAEVYLDYKQSQPEFAQYLKRNLSVLHDIARANSTGESVTAAHKQGKKDALESAARSQASSAPASNATNPTDSNKITAEKVREWASDPAQYQKHRNEILAWERQQMGLK